MAADPRQVAPVFRNSPDMVARLAGLPTASLVEAVGDGNEPFWRRRACARALTGHPLDRGAVAVLMGVIQDDTDTTGVRVATMELLASVPGYHHSALLTWLQDQGSHEAKFGMAEGVLCARAVSGDVTITREMVELAATPWRHWREPAEAALDRLIEICTAAEVLAHLGVSSVDELMRTGATPAAWVLGVRLLARAGGDIRAALGDLSNMVARTAYTLILESAIPSQRLEMMVEDGHSGALWALAVLAARGVDIEELWIGLGSPTIALPGVPSDVRQAIVRQYAPGQRDTDPRWLIEKALVGDQPPAATDRHLALAARALQAAGLDPQPPAAADDDFGGHGTYYEIATTGGTVVVSTLGPYYRGFRQAATIDIPGLRRIDDDLGNTIVDGLCVYFFGDREPLRVYDLLFYWQD